MKDSKQMELIPSISLQEDTLANLSPSQVEKKVKMIRDTSGQSILDLSKNAGRLGLLEKMLVDTLNSVSTPLSRTWKVKTTPLGRLVFQLRASAPTTKERGSGLLPTPTTQEIEHPNLILTKTGRRLTKDGKNSHSLNLADTVRIWRTPDAHGGRGPSSEKRMKMKLEKKMPISLNDQVAHPHLMWPTPTSQTAGKGKTLQTLITKDGQPAKPGERAYNPKTGKHYQVTLDRAVAMWPTPAAHEARLGYQRRDTGKKGTQKSLTTIVIDTEGGREKTTGQLNPTWVEWLMGYPSGWTDLNASETVSSHKSPTTLEK